MLFRSGLLVNYARCCFPVPGDAILAHLSAGRGMTVHREECANVEDYRKHPEKWLSVTWSPTPERNVGKVVFFAKHIDVMDTAEKTFAERGIRYSSVRGDQSSTTRQKEIDAFVNDPDVQVAVCSLTAAGVGLNLQVASNLVLAELSWTDAEQTQAIDRVHRIGQAEPVTAWRVIATQTLDTRIAELIDKKAGLAARALDGAGERSEEHTFELQSH